MAFVIGKKSLCCGKCPQLRGSGRECLPRGRHRLFGSPEAQAEQISSSGISLPIADIRWQVGRLCQQKPDMRGCGRNADNGGPQPSLQPGCSCLCDRQFLPRAPLAGAPVGLSCFLANETFQSMPTASLPPRKCLLAEHYLLQINSTKKMKQIKGWCWPRMASEKVFEWRPE